MLSYLLNPLVITQKIRQHMLDDANAYNASLRDQTRNNKQQENWMDESEIHNIYKTLSKSSLKLMKKNKLNRTEYGEVLKFILLSLYVLIPPRRSQDFAEMKIRNYDVDKDNYYDGKAFHFIKYKTAKVYGRQEIKAPPKLRNILKLWLDLNPHDFILSSFGGKKTSISRMALLLNKIFGKNISTTMIRHIFLTNKLKGTPLLKERDELAEAMSHSVSTQENYRLQPPKK